MTEVGDIWIETRMQKLVAGVICLFMVGMFVARYFRWFGFGGF